MKVREVIRMVDDDGWRVVATRGSHRQYKHSSKPGRVTVPGKPNDDLAPGTLKHPQAGATQMIMPQTPHVPKRYGIVIEKAASNYSAYAPDLPGCVATGATVEEAEREMREAIKFHRDGLREDGQPGPEPTSVFEYVEA